MSTQQQPAPQTCDTCGKPPSGDIDEAVTHCEWCGAEYPAPEDEEKPTGS
jgi:hypothetical protein